MGQDWGGPVSLAVATARAERIRGVILGNTWFWPADQLSVRRPLWRGASLDVLGDRWALLVVRDLLLGPKRFTDLLEGLPGASPNMITQRLSDLTASGVVRRRQLPPPAEVWVYELTGKGRDLEPVLLHLGRWGADLPYQSERRILGHDSLVPA